MSIPQIKISKILILDSEPEKKVPNQFWFNTTNNYLYRYNGTSSEWERINVSSDNIDVLKHTSGGTITTNLTAYLNSQFSIVAEGLDSLENSKQNKQDDDLSTNTKTIVGAINELDFDKQDKSIMFDGCPTTVEDALVEINNKLDPVNNLDALTITPTTTTDGVSITSTSSISGQSKPGNVIITPSINNVGAIYVGTSASSKPTSLPIYPDTVVQYSDSNLDNLFIFVDSIGDSCGVQISYNE